MYPVLAEQELHVVATRQQQFQADAERDQIKRVPANAAWPTTLMTATARSVAQAWLRVIRSHAGWIGHRPAPEIGEGPGGSSV